MKITLSDLVKEKNIWEKNNLDPNVKYCVRGEDFDNCEIFFSRYGIAPDDMGPTFGKKFSPGDILYLTRNPQLRKVAIADREGYCGEKVIVCTPKQYHGFESRLLPYIFQSESFAEHTLKNTIGSTNKHIRWKDVVSFKFNILDREKQNSALVILDKFHECYMHLNETILSVRKLYQDVIDAEVGIYLATTSAGKKNDWSSLSDSFLINPKIGSVDEIIPYVDMASLDVELPYIDYKGETKSGKSSGMKFRKDDILLARITPCFENGKAAFVDFLAEESIAVGSTEFIVMRSKFEDHFLKKLGYYIIKTKKFRHYALHHMEGSSGRQRVTVRVFDDIFIHNKLFTDSDILVKKLESLEKILKVLRDKKEHYFNLRQALIYELLGV